MADIIPIGGVIPATSLELVWQRTSESDARIERAADAAAKVAVAAAGEWPTEHQRIAEAQLILSRAREMLEAQTQDDDGPEVA